MPRISVRRSATLLAVLVGSLAGARPAAAEVDTVIKITPGSGDVMVRRYRAMPWRPAPPRQSIPSGTDVQCPQGCKLTVGATNLTLDPGASVALAERFFVPLEPGQSLVPATRLELKEGALEARATGGAPSRPMVITTPNFAMVAFRTAEVRVQVTPDQTRATVMAGTARVDSHGSWATVDEGLASLLPSGGPPSPPYAAPTSVPTWSARTSSCGHNIVLSEVDHPAGLQLCWGAVKSAASYRVQLARSSSFSDVVDEETSGSSELVSKPLPVGRYFARVQTVDARGNLGAPSPTRSVGIMGVALPAGGFLDPTTQTIVMPLQREARVVEEKALELSFAKGPFLPMPSSIRADKPTMQFRARWQGDASSETDFFVDDRAIRADIQLSPKTATWPVDPIDIVMQIRDPSGRVDPATVEPHTQVLIGREEIAVKWSHVGALWRTRLLPRPVTGPTVIRVIAADQTGAWLGRGFVEVAFRDPGPAR